MEVDDLRVGIEQRKRSAPVAVARLPHRPGIDQISRMRFQLQRHRFRLPRRLVFRAEAIGRRVVHEKSALQMRVTEKS